DLRIPAGCLNLQETASSGPPTPATTSEPQPPQQQCAYFVARKQRQCRLRPLPGQSLCVEHCPAGSAAPGDSRGHRIPCPLDPKHTVYASQLDRHLTRCNSRPRLVGQPFYRQGVNSCDSPEDRTRDLSWSLLDPPEHVHRRLDQIIALVDSLIPDSDVADQPGDADQPIWPMMAAQLSNAARRAATSFKSNKRRINKKPPAQKVQSYSSSSDDDEDDDGEGGSFENGEPRAVTNLRQQANLLALAEKSQLLRSPCAYVEFGAGKGHLCHWVARYWFESNSKKGEGEPADSNAYLLIDRGSVRNKLDCAHKYSGQRFSRIRVDIADLLLRPLLLPPAEGPMKTAVAGSAASSRTLSTIAKTSVPIATIEKKPVSMETKSSDPVASVSIDTETSVSIATISKSVSIENKPSDPIASVNAESVAMATKTSAPTATVEKKPVSLEAKPSNPIASVDTVSVSMETENSVPKEIIEKKPVSVETKPSDPLAFVNADSVSMETETLVSIETKPSDPVSSVDTVSVSMATTDSDPIASPVGNPVSETPASSKQKGGKKVAAPAVTTSAADVRAASRCGVTALGKHLCGAATDLALRCLAGLDADAEDNNSGSHGCSDSKRARIAGQLAEADRSAGVGPVGGVIALCCHHRCLWSAYVGKRRMASLGIGPEDFHAISRMAGWATCASKAARLKRKPQEDRRELIGLKCKRLIDSGRVAFLTEQLGYSARLVRYAKRSDTPENCALLFSRGI
uniref:tRNA:m(4)X modification enzyme TRM13 n=2 Tax=Macrostomum lignano TaxID=282301 RepID=A0A1I8IH77_9PLAT